MSKKWKYVNFETKAANKQQVDEHAAFFLVRANNLFWHKNSNWNQFWVEEFLDEIIG